MEKCVELSLRMVREVAVSNPKTHPPPIVFLELQMLRPLNISFSHTSMSSAGAPPFRSKLPKIGLTFSSEILRRASG